MIHSARKILSFVFLITLSYLLFISLSPVYAQEVPVLDPAIAYKQCQDATAGKPEFPSDYCQKNFPREGEYKNCVDLASRLPDPNPAIENCRTTYVNIVTSDHLGSCLSKNPSNPTLCQNTYGQGSDFAKCISDTKNPSICEGKYGLKTATPHSNNTSQTRDAIISFTGFGIDPTTQSLGNVITNALQIVFIAAALIALIYLIIGAFKWILSGGDKDAIGKARGTIIAALVGLTILALAFFATVLFGQVLNINILNLPSIPSLNQTPSAFPSGNP